MITVSTTTAVIVGMVLAAWLAAAVWATIVALRQKALGERAAEAARRGGALLETAPAIFVLVEANDRLQAGPNAEQWLGIDAIPKKLAGLSAALAQDYLESLTESVRSCRQSAKPFVMELRLRGSSRILFVRGTPAPALIGSDRAVVLWIFDATDMRGEMAVLQSRAHDATNALDALSALIEAAPFPMWHRAPDLRLTLVNQAYVRAVEAENAAEAVARGLELIDLRGVESPQAVAAKVRQEGEAVSRMVPATIGGERRMMRIVDVSLGEAGVAGYAVDVEELEQARAELRRFAGAQRDMLDLLSAGVVQFGPDRSLTFFNQPFQRLFAMEDEWLADEPEFDRILDRMREAGRLPEERDYPAWKAERRDWFQSSAAAEEAWHLPDGTHLRVVAQPMPDGGLLLVFEDRTEQVQLASARDTLLRVRTATFDNLFEGIGVFAADGRLHLWNSRFQDIWGFEEELLASHPRIDALSEQIAATFEQAGDARAIRDAVGAAAAERNRRSGRFALKDGRSFEYAAVPLPDGNALVTLIDISASQRIEAALLERTQALEEADRVKTAFVSNMSYELRTPLTSIAGFAEMLDGGYAGKLPEKAADYVATILESVAKLRTQIDEILDLTQSEAGSLPMAEEEIDLQLLCDEAANAARDAATRRGHELVTEIDWSVGGVIGDPHRLRQALDHLLRNAIRYTPEGGRVLLHAEGDAKEARITVADNGTGIAAEEQARVFDRFHRGEAGAGDSGRSLGLGLPLTKQFVEGQGGSIHLESEPGEGTFVTITLPREPAT
ncbi:MAG: PAS-domain containing protein [Parasphingopyxis sp.]|uniref:sensor histidine kinase n=1 Tax=Parasphingopyxis sp. TaxID=1920299 RepID=UPI0032EAEDCA